MKYTNRRKVIDNGTMYGEVAQFGEDDWRCSAHPDAERFPTEAAAVEHLVKPATEDFATIGYRIESAYLPQSPGMSHKVYFLDAVQEDENGTVSTTNICSGDESYCLNTLAKIAH